MFKIFTLIKREIYDYLAYFLGALILSLIIAIMMISAVFRSNKMIDLLIFESGFTVGIIFILAVGFSSMGIIQMYIDRTRRISAYLSALSVNRRQILISKIFTGVLAMFTFFIPMAITGALLSTLINNPFPTNPAMLVEILIVVFLFSFACYCIGLQIGWDTGKIFPIFGGITLNCIFVTLVFIKGFNFQIIAILILFIAVSLLRIGYKWMSTSL